MAEHLDEDGTLIAIGDDFRPAQVATEAALLPLDRPAVAHENTIPKVDDLLDTDVGSEGFPSVAIPVHHGVAAVDVLLRPIGVCSHHDMRISGRLDPHPVTPPEGVVRLPRDLHVLLRHRL